MFSGITIGYVDNYGAYLSTDWRKLCFNLCREMSIPGSVSCRGQSSRLYAATKYEARRGYVDGGDHVGRCREVKEVKEAVSEGWKEGRRLERLEEEE